MFLAVLTVIGVLISDIALAVLDPRIRLQGAKTR
jgi:peptide/nickel transport system permease protein